MLVLHDLDHNTGVTLQSLVFGRRDTEQGAHLRIRDFTAPEGISDHGDTTASA